MRYVWAPCTLVSCMHNAVAPQQSDLADWLRSEGITAVPVFLQRQQAGGSSCDAAPPPLLHQHQLQRQSRRSAGLQEAAALCKVMVMNKPKEGFGFILLLLPNNGTWCTASDLRAAALLVLVSVCLGQVDLHCEGNISRDQWRVWRVAAICLHHSPPK